MSRESRIAEQEKQFRNLSELTWTRNTIYPRDRDEFEVWNSRGQCGITNFGLGVWLVWRELAHPCQLLYVEGKVRHSSNDELIDNKHAWLLVNRGLSLKTRHADLALDQYNAIGKKIVTGNIDKPKGTSSATCYEMHIHTNNSSARAVSVRYEPDVLTPLAEYDTAKFDGRLDRFLGSCYNSTAFMGQQAVKGTVDRLWLPVNTTCNRENRLATISMKPCDAQLFPSISG